MMFSVSSQAYVFLCTIIGGMAIAFVYDIFRIFRKAVKTGSVVTYAQDLLYWLIVAVIMFITIYYSNDGELRGYLFIGAFIGVVLYALLFSRIVMNSSLFIIRTIVKVVKCILLIISYPFRMLLKILAIPARKLGRIILSSLKKAGSAARIKALKPALLKKALYHTGKKK